MKYPLLLLLNSLLASSLLAKEPPNILFLAVDDLKPMLGCYGNKEIKTPNFDRLAEMGTTFLNAHCQQAVCGPSRASLLTGWRPDRTKVWDLKTRIRDINPDVVTLPQYFKENGYTTVGVGKTYDPRSVDGYKKNDPASWSKPYLTAKESTGTQMGYRNSELVSRIKDLREKHGNGNNWWNKVKKDIGGTPAVEGSEDVPDNAYDDGAYADVALEQIASLSKGDKPFFLAVGFKKPHLPFIAPKKYWDLYKREDIQLAQYREMPQGAPEVHFQDSWELKNGTYSPYGTTKTVTDDNARELIHGYMACVSYIDAQIGKLLDALDEHKIAEKTIVVLWGDHGFHLGDHGMFCKHTNYEQATRVPLIIAKTAETSNKAIASTSPVEFVDVYPTLTDMAGLETPETLDGVSLKGLLDGSQKEVKPYAVSQYPRHQDKKSGGKVMGYAFRSDKYRYIEWVPQGNITAEPLYREFYDYSTDPLEKTNAIGKSEYSEAIAEAAAFSKTFRKGQSQW